MSLVKQSLGSNQLTLPADQIKINLVQFGVLGLSKVAHADKRAEWVFKASRIRPDLMWGSIDTRNTYKIVATLLSVDLHGSRKLIVLQAEGVQEAGCQALWNNK